MVVRLLGFIGVLMISSAPIWAHVQTGTIRGYVRDSETGETLPGANVSVGSLKTGATTDRGGYFVIQNLPSDD